MRTALLALLIAVLLVAIPACSNEPPPQQTTKDGITYKAETRIEKSSKTADVSPFSLNPWITMTNTSDKPITVLLMGCRIGLRLYKNSSRSGKPIWDL